MTELSSKTFKYRRSYFWKKNEGKLYLKSGIELIIITIIEMESHCAALAGLKLTK